MKFFYLSLLIVFSLEVGRSMSTRLAFPFESLLLSEAQDTVSPQLGCKPFLAANTLPLAPGQDADGDGIPDRSVWLVKVEDLLLPQVSDSLEDGAISENDLSEVWQYSINMPGEPVDSIRSQFLWTCDDYPIPDELQVRVWDEAGNYRSCSLPFMARDTREACGHCHPITNLTGWVRTEAGVGVPNVGIKFRDITWDNVTWLDGYYNGCGLDDNLVTVAAFKYGDFLEGVSTLDLVLLHRVVLALDTLPSPYKLLAADVNNDQKISTLDIIELQRAMLGISDSFSNNTAWRFISENYRFPTPTNPWREEIIQTIDFSLTNYGLPGNFIAIKIGDLNDTAPVLAF